LSPGSIRQAGLDDVAAIAAVIDAAYSPYIPVIGDKPRPMHFDNAERVARGEHYLVEDGGQLLAVLTLGFDKRDDALHIFNIAVDPAAQGRGLLRPLLAFAEARAREAGKPWLTLYTHELMTRNRAIYAHIGFEVLGTERLGEHDIYFMQRPVPPAA
jgi:ribosomal protein S18 acetylase RimI-like enzyme